MESEEAGKQEGWEVRKGLRNSVIEELGDGIEEESEIGEEAGKPEKAHPGEIRSAVVNEFHEAGSSKIKEKGREGREAGRLGSGVSSKLIPVKWSF